MSYLIYITPRRACVACVLLGLAIPAGISAAYLPDPLAADPGYLREHAAPLDLGAAFPPVGIEHATVPIYVRATPFGARG